MATWPDARLLEFQALLSQVQVEDGQVVCDLPSGGGYLSRYLSSSNLIFQAMETSEYFFNQCPEDDNHDRYLCDLADLPLDSASVDRVFSMAGLHHVEDRFPVYSEIERILKPGGLAVVADANAGSATANFLNTFVHENNSMGHQGRFLQENDLDEMERSCLVIQSDHQIDYHWGFASAADMSAYSKALFGLDMADQATILKGIHKYLGYEESNNGVEMAWGLRFITVSKPA